MGPGSVLSSSVIPFLLSSSWANLALLSRFSPLYQRTDQPQSSHHAHVYRLTATKLREATKQVRQPNNRIHDLVCPEIVICYSGKRAYQGVSFPRIRGVVTPYHPRLLKHPSPYEQCRQQYLNLYPTKSIPKIRLAAPGWKHFGHFPSIEEPGQSQSEHCRPERTHSPGVTLRSVFVLQPLGGTRRSAYLFLCIGKFDSFLFRDRHSYGDWCLHYAKQHCQQVDL